MNIYVFRLIKNIFFLCVKLALVVLWLYILITNCCDYAIKVINDFSDYQYIRGFETYGEETVANLRIRDNVYIYKVDDIEYLVERDVSNIENIDKSIDIYYDILEPSESILKEELIRADSFYSNTFKGITYVYIMSVISVFCLGFSFFILDKLKYHKLIWKQIV